MNVAWILPCTPQPESAQNVLIVWAAPGVISAPVTLAIIIHFYRRKRRLVKHLETRASNRWSFWGAVDAGNFDPGMLDRAGMSIEDQNEFHKIIQDNTRRRDMVALAIVWPLAALFVAIVYIWDRSYC